MSRVPALGLEVRATRIGIRIQRGFDRESRN
jgi:hypothetical protein